MAEDNSQNSKKGKDFQEFVREVLVEKFGVDFVSETAFAIGNPAKDHKFSLVSIDSKIIAVTKNYSWTETGNVPSGKMASLNETVFYLQHAPSDTKKLIVLKWDKHPKRKESLAEYYFRTYKHLLDDVKILEVDSNTRSIKEITFTP